MSKYPLNTYINETEQSMQKYTTLKKKLVKWVGFALPLQDKSRFYSKSFCDQALFSHRSHFVFVFSHFFFQGFPNCFFS